MKQNNDMDKTWTVYIIKENGVERYVGVCVNLDKRIWEHMHNKKPLHGRNKSAIPFETDKRTITFSVFGEYDNKDKAVTVEDELIMAFDTIQNGWNKQRSGYRFTNDPIGARKGYISKFYDNHPGYERERAKRRWQTEEYRAYHHEYYQKQKALKAKQQEA